MHPSTDSKEVQNQVPAEAPDEEHGEAESTPTLSEVAMRINLLGKLILPPDPR